MGWRFAGAALRAGRRDEKLAGEHQIAENEREVEALGSGAERMRASLPEKSFAEDKSQNDEFQMLGFSFLPIPNVVLKAEDRDHIAEEGELSDEVNRGAGLVF